MQRRRRPDIVDPPVQTRLDRLIGAISPAWALERVAARARLGVITRRFDGGSYGRRTEGWVTPGTDGNAAAAATIQTLRNRCRDLARNNSWAGRGCRAMKNAVVGTGIMLRLADPEGKPLEGQDAKDMRAAWRKWALTTECDADGLLNLYGIQRLIQNTLMQSGEVLVRRRWRRPSDGLTVPFQLQVLEPDHLDRTRDGWGMSQIAGRVTRRINGIEFDELNRRIGYWLFREHPGSGFLRDMRSSFVDDSDIIHLYRVDRPGQVVGIPPLAPAIIRTRDLFEFEDAWLMRNKIAAMFAGFVHDASDADTLGTSVKKNPDGTVGDTFEPGTIEILPPGKEITFTDPPDLSGYSDYTQSQLRAIAVSIDVTYEQLTSDLRGTNFTSGRMGMLTHYAAVDDWQWDVMIPRFCDQLAAWFVLGCELANISVPADVMPGWTPPARAMIDPAVETAAAIRRVRAGMQPYSEMVREQGYERDEVLEQATTDFAEIRKRKLLFEVDPLADVNRVQKDTTGDKNNGGRVPNKPKPAAGD